MIGELGIVGIVVIVVVVVNGETEHFGEGHHRNSLCNFCAAPFCLSATFGPRSGTDLSSALSAPKDPNNTRVLAIKDIPVRHGTASGK